MLSGKRVLLIVGGGIAAYKTPELVRLIRKAGGMFASSSPRPVRNS